MQSGKIVGNDRQLLSRALSDLTTMKNDLLELSGFITRVSDAHDRLVKRLELKEKKA